jgi:hypothetical protein
MGSEFASSGNEGDRFFGSSSFYFVVSVLAARFLGQLLAQNFCAEFAGIFTCSVGSDRDRCWGIFMQLKLFVLSGAAVFLWLTPLTALDKRIAWHKSMQGLSLCAAIACAVSAGNIARELFEQGEIEEIKTRAITADVIDEISTSAYVSQQQRQQEAEAILASPAQDLEARRKALEAIYTSDLQEISDSASAPDFTSAPDSPEYFMYLEVCKSREAGKTNTWIIENILKMKGRKFAEGKVKLQGLLAKFGSNC